MSELNQIPHIPDGFSMGEAIASHDGVVCYPAMRNGSDDKYIVKNISVPSSGVQLAALQISGACANREEALAYYKDRAQEILQEVRILNELSNLEGFLPYRHAEISEKPEQTGYEVTLVAPYRLTLEQMFEEQVLTHQGIMDLAMDLCSALAACRRAGYLYMDLKPANIFYTENMDHRIGDLGFTPLSSLRFACLPDKYHSIYTPPEIEDAYSQLNATMDVYALGLILYQAYNGGSLPLNGNSVAHPLMPPMYADYEIAEIILTACHPDASRRWDDPTSLGQALVQYMQRNGIPEGPIIPPPVTTPELDLGDEFLPEEDVDTEWADIPELDFADLPEDPQTDAEENDNTVIEMLAKADELIAHTLPDPVVQPEPVEIPMPDPIVLSVEVEENGAVEEPVADEAAPVDEQPPAETSPAEDQPTGPVEETPAAEVTAPPVAVPVEDEEDPAFQRKGKKWIRLIVIAVAAALLITLAVFGIRAYQEKYQKTVEALTITGTVDTITVHLRTDADEALLKVSCSDTYGNTLSADVVDGKAQFTGLTPQTRYTIRVTISGGYKLSGKLSDSFTTASQTSVENLTIGIGPADGSAFLSFQVSGVECDAWVLTWSADDVQAQSTTFTGHSVTVYDLIIGKEYTFTLSAGDGSNVVGQTQISYLARPVVRAQNITVNACGDGLLTLTWETPAGETVTGWTLHCFNEAGYDVTVTTTDCSYTFQDLTHDTPCTVEITAQGMTQSESITIGANPINITKFAWQTDENGNLLLDFTYTGNPPVGGWILTWSCDGSQAMTLTTEQLPAVLPLIPGGQYTVSVIPADHAPVFGHTCSFTMPDADRFESFGITLANLQLTMCATPAEDDWQWSDIAQDAYRTSFLTGETAGFVVWCDTAVEDSQSAVGITFVLRDNAGNLVSCATMECIWSEMWNQGFCELNVPNMPTTPGNYSLWIYFNGMYVAVQDFTME